MLNAAPSPGPIRIAIYRTSSLGDIVLGFACLDLLGQLQVPSEVTWIGRGPTMDLIRHGWPEVKVVEVAKSDTMNEVQKAANHLGPIHLLVDLQNNLRSRYFARTLKKQQQVQVFTANKAQLKRSSLIANARIRGRRRPLPEEALHPDKLQYEMMLDALKKALRFQLPVELLDELITADAVPRIPMVLDAEDNKHSWHKELRFGKWLAIAPGASTIAKKAPKALFIEIINHLRRLVEENDAGSFNTFGLVLLGDENDRNAARDIIDELHWQGPVLNLSGRLSLWESAVALKEAACLISNDSSLSHIAEAVHTPTATLFGPTIESFGFAPRMRHSRAYSAPIGCRPCSKHGKIPCRYGDHLCFHSIPTAPIAAHLYALMEPSAPNAPASIHQEPLQP